MQTYKTAITVLLGEPSSDFPLLQNQDSEFSGTRFIAMMRYSSSASLAPLLAFARKQGGSKQMRQNWFVR